MIVQIINIAKALLGAVYKCFWIFPQRKKMVLLSRQRNKPSVDFLLIADAVSKHYPQYQTVILCKKLPLTAGGVLKYVPHLFAQLHHLATCTEVVIDGYVPAVSILKHRPNVTVLQTWHALGAIKKFGHQAVGTKFGRSAQIAESMQMHENYDYVLCAGDGSAPAFCEAFNITKDKLLLIAPPYTEKQLDAHHAETARERVIAAYPQLLQWKKERTVLYIPTFHGKIPGLNELIATLLEDGYQVIFSRHPLDNVNSFDSRLLDDSLVANNYIENTKCTSLDLQHVAGHIITDYSATVLDAALIGTPFCFYVPDIESYRKSPGLNIDPLIEFPSISTKHPSEVLTIIKNRACTQEALLTLRTRYLNHVQPNAAAQIVQTLINTKG